MESRRIYALIPAYQPNRTMAGLVRDLDKEGQRVIVVDDGSGPDYGALFAICGERSLVLRHETNRGKGAALKTGLTWLRENVPGPYTVVTLDADGQHTASDTVKVAQVAEEDPTALVLGSRRQGRGCPLRSRFGNGVTRLVYRAAARTSVYDTQTGLRAFSSRLVSTLLAFLTGWNIFANIAARFVSAGVNFSVNRWLVFKDKGPFRRSAAQYFALAAGILAANSAILFVLTALGFDPYVAKLLTEGILFVCSFTVQKKVIFRKKALGAERSAVRYEEVLEA